MRNTTRVPRKISDFNGYLQTSDDYLQLINPGPPPVANWQRLGLTQEEADQWHATRLSWDSQLYPKYLSPNTKTKTVNEEVAEAMELFRLFAQPLLGIMATSRNATPQDANALNFKIGRSEPTHPTVPIAEQCHISLESMGSARVKFGCRAEMEGGRAALPDDADSVQIAYKIGGTVPVNAEDGTQEYIVTRASDVRDLGVAHEGQVLYVFARWYSMRHPELAGVWSPMNTVRL